MISNNPTVIRTKVAIAIKAARNAANLSQDEISDILGIAKSTIARIETLEQDANLSTVIAIFEMFESIGITVNIFQVSGPLIVSIDANAIDKYRDKLSLKRRSDRKKGEK